MSDLYKILGVSKRCKRQTIINAFRRLAKEKHPDHGGDAEEFMEITEAYQVLKDDKLRAHYDKTGVIDRDVLKDARTRAENLIIQAFDQALASGLGAQENVDIIEQVLAAMKDARRKHTDRVAKLEREVVGLKRLKNNIRRKDSGENVFTPRVEQRIEGLERQIQAIKYDREMLDSAMEELDNYETVTEFAQGSYLAWGGIGAFGPTGSTA